MNVFICFAAEDRYKIAEPIAYNLKNYGINIWYDRLKLLLGDNRIQKNLIEGASQCKYAVLIVSSATNKSKCAMEEIAILKNRFIKNDITLFPVIYELKAENIPLKLKWIKKLIYKEANHSSGTREICNHIVCKITLDILNKLKVKKLQYFIQNDCFNIPYVIIKFLLAYQGVASENLNARIALLYAIYVYIIAEHPCAKIRQFISKIYDRIYNEARLCLEVDYRELWLLENSLCILINDIYLE